MDLFRISIAQPTARNQMDQIQKLVNRAHQDNSKLILFPEGFLPSYIKDMTMDMENKIIQKINKLSKKNNIAIAVGIKERDKDKNYLSLILSFEGEILAKHRKVILASFEKNFFSPGDLLSENQFNFPVVQVGELGKIGLLLCYENLFPETHRLLRIKGAEIVLAPSGFGMKGNYLGLKSNYYKIWLSHLRCRAMENQTYVVASTNDIEYLSDLVGVIIDPLGRTLVNKKDRDGTQEYGTAEINLSHLRKLRNGERIYKGKNDYIRLPLSNVPKEIYTLLSEFYPREEKYATP